MSALIDDAAGGGNVHEFTVSELSGRVKRLIEDEFGHVRVRGEVGRVMLARSGHLYFDLKDERAVISAVSWKGQVARLAVMPEEGMEVVATGRMTTFAGQSKYQLIVESVEPAGAGALMAMLEMRKKKLAAEGLFAAERKKKLPYLPEVIGVVTSPSGAVIRDILHRLRDRFPRRVLIWPAAVQGQACAPEVARGIRGFNALPPGGPIPRPDLIIVARGGGSVEDLWGFNEEEVVRAAAESEIPLISAVGHETDTTLIDYAADVRAPTPTAAAELAVPVRLELLSWVSDQGARLDRAMAEAAARRRQRVSDLARALPRPESLVEAARQRLDRAGDRLLTGLDTAVQRKKLRLAELSAAVRPESVRARLREARAAFEARAGRLQPSLLRRDIERRRQRLDEWSERLRNRFAATVAKWRDRFDSVERMRQTLGYRETLRRGYTVVRAGEAIVTEAARARSAAALEIEFHDGRVAATPSVPGSRKSRGAKEPPDQGSLF